MSEEFWSRKATEWQTEEQQIKMAIQGLQQIEPERILDSVRILELANKAYFLYLKQTPAEKATQNGAFELLDRRRKYPSDIQKAVRPDLYAGKKRGMVRSSGFEPPRYCYRQPLKLVRLPVPPRPRFDLVNSL